MMVDGGCTCGGCNEGGQDGGEGRRELRRLLKTLDVLLRASKSSEFSLLSESESDSELEPGHVSRLK